jgi:four helix bundle protein
VAGAATVCAMAIVFEKLIVGRKAVDFADHALAASEHFPRSYGLFADPVNRAAVSIAANLAEGNGRFTKPDWKRFFGIARGSIQECAALLDLARRHALLDEVAHADLRQRLEELGKMISGLINGVERHGV